MIIPIKKIILESLQNKTKHKVIVYGEAHFHRDEVDRIRNDIIKLKPDIIIHELPEDHKFYKIHLPSTRFYQLERGLDQNIYKYFKGDYKKQFEIREKNMLRNIDFVLSDGLVKMPPKVVAIVVGDTHLRTIDTPELGPKSPFYNRDYTIIRSKYKEIKWLFQLRR